MHSGNDPQLLTNGREWTVCWYDASSCSRNEIDYQSADLLETPYHPRATLGDIKTHIPARTRAAIMHQIYSL